MNRDSIHVTMTAQLRRDQIRQRMDALAERTASARDPGRGVMRQGRETAQGNAAAPVDSGRRLHRPASTVPHAAPWPELPPWRCWGPWCLSRLRGRRYATLPTAGQVLGGKALFLGGAAQGERASQPIASRRQARTVPLRQKREGKATRSRLWRASRRYRLWEYGRQPLGSKTYWRSCQRQATAPSRSYPPPFARVPAGERKHGVGDYVCLGPRPSVTRSPLPVDNGDDEQRMFSFFLTLNKAVVYMSRGQHQAQKRKSPGEPGPHSRQTHRLQARGPTRTGGYYAVPRP